MSLVCSNCSKRINVTKVIEQRGEGLATEIRCYHCDAWLAKSVRIAKIKMVCFYAVVLLIAVAYFVPELKVVAIILSIFSGIGLMISHFMDHLFTTERPPEEDVTEELKKYR